VTKAVRIRRPDRVIAASLLTALGACLALLAQPSAASSLDSYDLRASVRYGCAQDSGDDNFVEVTLRAEDWDGDDRDVLLQVGLAGPESPDSAGVFLEGGPSLVTLGEKAEKVRLAGPVHDGDHVFLRQVDSPEIINLPLQPTCHRIKPTNFGLAEPAVQVTTKSCTSGSQANLRVSLDNPNDVDQQLQKIGIDQIDYTVLLVRQDGKLAGTDPVGTLMSFDEPSSSAITVSQVVDKPARYEIRVIALDGAVVTSDSLRLSCAGSPVPSSTSRPSPSVSVTLPPSSSLPPSTPAPTPTATATQPPTSPAPSSSSAPSSSAASSSAVSSSPAPTSSAPASSAPASSTPPGTSQSSSPTTSSPASSSPASSSPAGNAGRPTAGSSPSRSRPAPGPGNSGVQPPNSALPSGPTSSAASLTSAPSIIRLVEPRADYGGLPVFQKDVALVVLLFSAALTALVGSAVVNARRR
jgi:hypothetical protein